MQIVTEQPIKKFEFFRCPQSLPGVAPLTKKPEDSGYEIADALECVTEQTDKGLWGWGREIVCTDRIVGDYANFKTLIWKVH